MRKLTGTKWCYPILLAGLFVLLMLAIMPEDGVYGSVTDWFSQHAALAETIRTACVEQRTLLPSVLPLGGGSNGFQFAYYGYLRPDILLGCLFPQVPMLPILIGYTLAGYLAAVLLFYEWCRQELNSPSFSFLGSILFMTANCFFQTHRQLMFINYLPFLMLALLCIQRKKYPYVGILITLILFHSFYYIIPVLVVLGWYWYQKTGRGFWRQYLLQAVSGIGMAALLLVPTAMVILEHHRSSADAMNLETGVWEPHMEFLLYSSYGVGMTMLPIYLLLSGLADKKYRKNSLCLLLIICLGWSAYLMNGTLYARGKIMVPFLPLLVLHCVRILQDRYQSEKRWGQWQFLIIGGIVLLADMLAEYRVDISICIDIVVLLLVSLLLRLRPAWKGVYALLLIMPVMLYVQAGTTETYVNRELVQEMDDWQRQKYETDTHTGYRSDTLYEYLNTSNRMNSGICQRSSMYSSVTNQAYTHVYYDCLQTPIRINNRVALVTENNPFMLQFMGVRYLEALEGQLPDGYDEIEAQGTLVLGENKTVLPIAYGVTKGNTLPESQFQKAAANEQLELLMKQTVVADKTYEEHDTGKGEKTGREGLQEQQKTGHSEMVYEIQKTAVQGQFSELPEGLEMEPTGENAWLIHAEKEQTVTYALNTSWQEEILMLQFDVVNQGNQAVVIDINTIRNKLSGRKAPYPNGNTQFHYQLTGTMEQPLSELTITFSKGTYEIQNLSWYRCPTALLQAKQYQPLEVLGTEGRNLSDRTAVMGYRMLTGTIAMSQEGYLVTSIPLQRGMQLYVDGKQTKLETVNLAFAGGYLSEGTHMVELIFIPPGLYWGIGISIGMLVIYLGQMGDWYRRKRNWL